ncbi:hypothetical protein [Maribellus mangrovi]|uniref:hypothetical protein n=1 Tax=Maribellus mangrovi TaxID=3133146 RepID=UPI0030EECF82
MKGTRSLIRSIFFLPFKFVDGNSFVLQILRLAGTQCRKSGIKFFHVEIKNLEITFLKGLVLDFGCVFGIMPTPVEVGKKDIRRRVPEDERIAGVATLIYDAPIHNSGKPFPVFYERWNAENRTWKHIPNDAYLNDIQFVGSDQTAESFHC